MLVIYELGLLLCYHWMTLRHNNLCKLNIFHREVVCPREKMVCSLLKIHHLPVIVQLERSKNIIYKVCFGGSAKAYLNSLGMWWSKGKRA